ncbi:MAG: aminodeoxychorismate lyase [Alphaproteobacteria bacterium]|nr:aminodeoxychorismate lyase [Alphaproteobacteria bacterium]
MGVGEFSFQYNSDVDRPSPPLYVNGEAADTLPVSDRGLAYGDGLFETIAVREGKLEFWGRHLARLREGCERLRIPEPDLGELAREAERLLNGQRTIQGVDQGILKIIITRGSGGRGYRAPESPEPTRIVAFHPWPEIPDSHALEGVKIRRCDLQLSHQPALAGIKHLNRLENVLARGEWDDPDIAEGLLCDGEGNVIEGTMSNLFIEREGILLTPDLSRCGVAGIIRAVVMEEASSQGLCVEVTDIRYEDATTADALFLTNSVMGIWPVCELDGKAFVISPTTRALMERLDLRRRASGED